MKAALIRLVWRRAHDCCEYCQMPQAFDRTPFEIDHIRSEKHRGPTVAGNLCLSCFYCNSFMGSEISWDAPDVSGSRPFARKRIT
jgi:HNH endonuclease